MKRMEDAQEKAFGRADYRDASGARSDGRSVPEVRALVGDTFKYKAKFGGMTVSDAQRLRTLEGENGKLKKLLAEAMLDNAVLKDLASKNV